MHIIVRLREHLIENIVGLLTEDESNFRCYEKHIVCV